MANTNATLTRVARLRVLMTERGYDAVIIRNNADLRWLTGAERTFDDETAHTAFITHDDLWLHTDSRYFGTFVDRLGNESPWKLDMDFVSHAAWCAALVQKTHARVVALEDTATLAFADAFNVALSDASLACFTPRLHDDIANLRIVKDQEELDLMAHAQSITDAAFTYICTVIKPGMTEMQLKVMLENYMFEQGADALSFETILASGPNGANPHAQPGARQVQEHDMIVIDYGAGYHDYHSDMTRTVCVGEPTAEEKKVYDVVRLAHEECAKAAKPGCLGSDIHKLAQKVIADAGYGEYFNHGLGHGVGLEIHEMPRFSLTYDKEIPVGSVITIEPGIYLPQNFGVRLEDFGVMTQEGYKPFTASTHDLVCVGM